MSTATRPLLEEGSDVFIRYNEAIPVLRKIFSLELGGKGTRSLSLPESKRFSRIVSSRRPFGLESTFRGSASRTSNAVLVFQAGGSSYVDRQLIRSGVDLLDSWKVFIPFLASGSDSFPHPILGKPFIGGPGTACTETYLTIGPFDSKVEAMNAISYIATRLFRFVVLQRKPSQNATRKVYEFVPMQDFSRPWTDEDLYAKYGISDEEIAFIESMIRPMEASSE